MKRTSTFQHIVILTICGILLSACAAPAPAPTATAMPTSTTAPTATTPPTATPIPLPFAPPAEGRIIFTKPDKRKFAGMVYGQGKTAIILGNMVDGGEDQWSPFVKAFDRQKFTVITYLRLVGEGDGIREEANIVLQTLRDAGYQRIICIGANVGVLACASINTAPEMIGAVLIGGPNDRDYIGKNLNTKIFENITAYPKLFIGAEKDPALVDIKGLYEQTSQPKSLTVFPDESRHGIEIFYSPANKDAFLKLLMDFVNSLP